MSTMETESPTPVHQDQTTPSDPAKERALREYRRVLLQHKEADARVSCIRALTAVLNSVRLD